MVLYGEIQTSPYFRSHPIFPTLPKHINQQLSTIPSPQTPASKCQIEPPDPPMKGLDFWWVEGKTESGLIGTHSTKDQHHRDA